MLDPQLQSHIGTLWLLEIMVRLEMESFCPFRAEKCTFKNLEGILFFLCRKEKRSDWDRNFSGVKKWLRECLIFLINFGDLC